MRPIVGGEDMVEKSERELTDYGTPWSPRPT